jgi:xanthine dehydrogenase YagS FAD-binding subunit
MNMFPITARFDWVDAASVEQAAAHLGDAPGGAGATVVAKAGGTDLVDLLKEGIVRPSRVVNLRTIRGMDEVTFAEGRGLTLGALATMTRVEADPLVRERYPALAEAIAHAATPQVRNAATMGGNLLQKPRCWYFRSSHFAGGDYGALAREGENRFHAIFDNATCAMVTASTPATALLAYNASVDLTGPRGKTRTVRLADFYVPPAPDPLRGTILAPGEVLTRIVVPAFPRTARAAYHKQTERESYDWPICDVAVLLNLDGRTVRGATIAMGWVAPTPRRADEAERALVGRELTEDAARAAAAQPSRGATPLSKNAYKVPVLGSGRPPDDLAGGGGCEREVTACNCGSPTRRTEPRRRCAGCCARRARPA